MKTHVSCGVPNLAFVRAAKAIGGFSWARAGLIWYQVLAQPPARPTTKMPEFAARTRSTATMLFPLEAQVHAAADNA